MATRTPMLPSGGAPRTSAPLDGASDPLDDELRAACDEWYAAPYDSVAEHDAADRMFEGACAVLAVVDDGGPLLDRLRGAADDWYAAPIGSVGEQDASGRLYEVARGVLGQAETRERAAAA